MYNVLHFSSKIFFCQKPQSILLRLISIVVRL
uniref:Uncharacterized protein n=1 Tax=Rhizophora mucronata TaxID=61149 RepID=A0A2P2JP25_RHIMU